MEINKKNIEHFKEARKNYVLAFAINETNIKIDEESKQETLKENNFYAYRASLKKSSERLFNEYGKKITNPNQDYNMNDQDFKEYSIIADKKRKLKGLKLPYHKYEWAINDNWNLTADVESRPILMAAKRVFIRASLNILPQPLKTQLKQLDSDYHIQQEKFIDINLRLDLKENLTAKQLITEALK